MPTIFQVQPQRSNGVCYIPCEQHQATSFAVVKVETFTRKGRKFTTSRVVDRCATKTAAEGLASANNKRFAPTPAHLIRKLGRRIVKEKV